MRRRFSLTTKGILLVALPIAIEFIALAFLWHVVLESDKEAQKQANARDIAAVASHTLLYFFQHGFRVVIYKDGDQARKVQIYLELKETMKLSTSKLKQLSKDLSEPERLKVRAIEERMENALELIGKYVYEYTGPAHRPGTFDARAFRNDLVNQVLPLEADAKYFTDLSKTKELYGSWTQKASSERHLLLISALLLPNVIATVALSMFFAKSVRRRIHKIDSNVRRFLSGRMLDRSMPEEDEISELDQAFHRMSDKLIAADLEMKNYYDSMQRHLAEPLHILREILYNASKSESPLTEAGRAKMSKSVATAERLILLIEELGKVDTIASPGKDNEGMEIHTAPCRTEDILSSAVASVAEVAAKKEIALKSDCSQNSALNADSARLVQVIVNLLSNAIKFSPSGTVIEVCAIESEKDVEIHIKDQGPGIPIKEQARLFKRFEQIESITSRDMKGSGLGLSICRDIIMAHGGDIGVASEPGKGSDFWIRLPR